jgi:hypothetical protein
MKFDQSNTVYIGDAVYATFDGCGIELRLNSHKSECLIYLEPEVMATLVEFWRNASEVENSKVLFK